MIDKGAQFSPCRAYRYRLWRVWSEIEPTIAFVLLNPSTADEEKDDPTIRRCIDFARSWGYGGIVIANLFAWRATAPSTLYTLDDPVGLDNDGHLCNIAETVPVIVCAWGVHGKLYGRGAEVLKLLESWKHRLRCLGVTKDGMPRHPLYLGKTTGLERFS
jgi:hypothetical protein